MTAAIVAADVFVFTDERRFLTLRLTAGDGATGLGDVALGGRELLVADHLRRRLADLVGAPALQAQQRLQRHPPATAVARAAHAAVDVALWDLRARQAGRPLYELLGGAFRPSVPVLDGELPRTHAADRRFSLAEVGGVTAASALADQAAEDGARVVFRNPPWVSPVGRAALVHLGVSTPNAGPQEYRPHTGPLLTALEPSHTLRSGRLHPGAGPGLGVRLHQHRMHSFTHKKAEKTMSQSPRHIVVMGVSGSGKSTVGDLLGARIGLPYHDGDDLHPQSNIDKMAAGEPLTDEDRWPWLKLVGEWLTEHPAGGIIGCSALKRSYRDAIREAAPGAVFVHVHGSAELLQERMTDRPGHFMPPSLLDSQLDTLEHLGADETGRIFDISGTPDEIVAAAAAWISALE